MFLLHNVDLSQDINRKINNEEMRPKENKVQHDAKKIYEGQSLVLGKLDVNLSFFFFRQ